MQIAYIAAGAADMVCGSCLHDNTLARALIRMGEQVTLVPTYTPLKTDEENVSLGRVFFGGVNVFLAQQFAAYRLLPRWLTRGLDSPRVLRWATRGAGSVDPAQLGPMTVSMLRGELGGQRRELEELVDWLLAEVKPDIVHLSNSMLLGMARRISQRCGPPIVCALSGEDLFLEGLPQPYYDEVRGLLRERAAEVDAFTALNAYYADTMAQYLSVPRSRIHVVPHGVDLEGYGEAPPARGPGAPLRIGYLARVCHAKGLHQLVEACEQMAADPQMPAFELVAAGYLGKGDRQYLRDLERAAERGRLAGRFRYVGTLSRVEKIAFLQSLDLFSIPTVYQEAKGLPALEALACGVPVVLPDHGSFPEIIAATGGGVLFRAGDVAHLAETLRSLALQREAAQEHGERGRRAVIERFHADRMAAETLSLYQTLTGPPATTDGKAGAQG
ncbi:Capsular glucan synthase [Pirellulimonas nuda]|uniref:Capsular glucan synthase n=1 Tax=Pirellulimonas nuda TaxID=2528009 RepID=A0A518D9F8_9BACT|nr:glycosyltransferase family 4 protein [Pirellulimonas nuda]QDU88111.1 Capsular glucan synthase [Pirellulimonas nuda]